MSAERSDGGPAFPVIKGTAFDRDGMSLRDYFAAAVAPQVIALLAAGTVTPNPGETRLDSIARASYDIADAMLKARQA